MYLYQFSLLFILVYPYNPGLSTVHDLTTDPGLYNMASVHTPQGSADTHAPLSSEALVGLLMEYCNKQIRENAKIERDYAKELTNDKIEIVTKGFVDGIALISNAIKIHSTSCDDKIAALELKMDTLNKYFEENLLSTQNNLIPNVKKPSTVKNCSVCVKNPNLPIDTSAAYGHSPHFHCSSCKTVYQSVRELYYHQCIPSSDTHLPGCWRCGKTFEDEAHLQVHITEGHVDDVRAPCVPCEQAFRLISRQGEHTTPSHVYPDIPKNVANLRIPTSLDHAEHTVANCSHCDKTSQNQRNLSIHELNHVNHTGIQSSTPNYRQNVLPPMNIYDSVLQEEQMVCTTQPYFECNICSKILASTEDMNSHVQIHHDQYLLFPSSGPIMTPSTETHEHQSDVYSAMDHQDSNQHTISMLHCSKCEFTCYSMRYLNVHLQNHASCSDSGPSTLELSDIQQVDGNDSLMPDTSIIQTPVQPQHDPNRPSPDPTIISTGTSAISSRSQDIQHLYTLNHVNQAKKLLENTSRPEFSIKFSNPQTILGVQHPTSVSVDCNSGVYMTAIKPALQAIYIGWQTDILSTLIVCEDMSDRTDLSGRKVCTKIVLFMTEKESPNLKNKVVLHFYHTSCTLLAQGSSVMSCGTCSPVWLVKNFLEPLATTHSAQNRDIIAAVNTNIRQSAQSATFCCGKCNEWINPSATHPKDQELTCSKCQVLFHKRCTDRRDATRYWKKNPWYCPSCIRGTVPPGNEAPLHVSLHDNQNDQNRTVLNPSAVTFSPLSAVQSSSHSPVGVPIQPPPSVSLPSPGPGAPQVQSSISATQTQITETRCIPSLCTPVTTVISATASISDSTTVATNSGTAVSHASVRSTHSQVLPKFPATSSRQRSSNITNCDPELEFQKTALSACRSTISQQEAELKRLAESLDIRNKRIMQLEAQVGHASEFISARSAPQTQDISEVSLKSLSDKISDLTRRLERIDHHSPANNIVINTCQSGSQHARQHSSTQTNNITENISATQESPALSETGQDFTNLANTSQTTL